MSTILFDNLPANYRNESSQKPPKSAQSTYQNSADHIIKLAHQRIATVWQGDYHNAKTVLSAIKKRIRKSPKLVDNSASTFHLYRLTQAQHSQIINMLLVQIEADYSLNLPRAPNIQAALTDVYGTPNGESFLLPLNQLLGFIGAHEWHKKGVWLPELNTKIHVPFGVFSPLRGEYLSLMMQALLPENCQSAQDIGTGSGVLATILAQRGIAKIIATDNNPRAIACAQRNITSLNLTHQIQIIECDLFANEVVDLIVCNPPWLPAKPTSAIETALYDPNHTMLKTVLARAAHYLQPNGQLWLIMSDLAEYLGLREKNLLNQWFAQNNWQIVQKHSIQATHKKAQNIHDPLSFARNHETTFLFCLQQMKQ